MPKTGQPWDPRFAAHSELFAPFARLTRAFSAHSVWPTPAELGALVEGERARRTPNLPALQFTPSKPKARRARRTSVVLDALYDGSIARKGQVPCVVDSYHDLWNAIAFAAFPRSKHALHARQYRALERWATPGAARLPPCRTREQDALTVFDEGGSVLLGDASFFQRWRRSTDWLDVTDGSLAQVVLFGHALLELLGYGREEIRSCAVFIEIDDGYQSHDAVEWVDVRLAARIEDATRFTRPGADGVLRLDQGGRAWVGPPALGDRATAPTVLAPEPEQGRL